MSLLILPFISHAMTPEQYGSASILTASALLLATILGAPLEPMVFRASARESDDAPALIRIAGTYCYYILPLIVAIGAGAVALLIPELFGVAGTVWGVELLAIGFLPAATYFALPLIRARQNLQKFVLLALTSVLATGASKLLLIVALDLGVLGWALSDLVSAVISSILAMGLVRRPYARVTGRDVRNVAAFSVPLIPHRASFWALSSLSRPAMATVSSLAQVGSLAFGLNLASVANLILAEINQALLPQYSRENFPAPTDKTMAPVRWQIVAAFTVPALVGACVTFAGQWLFAESYWPSFKIAGILLCGQVAYGLYLIPMNYLVQAAALPKFSSVASLSGAVVIFVGIMAFGRQFGATGVAYATTAGFFVMATVGVILTFGLKLRIHWRSWKGCWPEVAVSLLGLASSVAGLSFPVGSAVGYGFAAGGVLLALSALAIASHRRVPRPLYL